MMLITGDTLDSTHTHDSTPGDIMIKGRSFITGVCYFACYVWMHACMYGWMNGQQKTPSVFFSPGDADKGGCGGGGGTHSWTTVWKSSSKTMVSLAANCGQSLKRGGPAHDGVEGKGEQCKN